MKYKARLRTLSVRQLQARRARLARAVPDVEATLRGALHRQMRRCGKAGCRCAEGELHGPYIYVSVRTGEGSRLLYVPADAVEAVTRQYVLAEEAARLGWPASAIVTIDKDLGLSGRSGSGRTGFKEVVSRVCLGEVGAIFGLEISRFARSSADLQRLLEFCSLSDTLIVDADGIYDLRNFNDRLLLGLKGTMSEAELHILAGRLQESKRAAARRGALRFPLPVGYVFDEAGHTVLDPHDEIQAAVADVFAAFAATGSAYGVVGRFQGRPFPRRAYGGAWAGEIRWGRLTYNRVRGLLSNPAYAGAYVFGRHHSSRVVDAEGCIRTRSIKRPQAEWPVLIQSHHPAYIGWEPLLCQTARLPA